jgi:hypothetical protein
MIRRGGRDAEVLMPEAPSKLRKMLHGKGRGCARF